MDTWIVRLLDCPHYRRRWTKVAGLFALTRNDVAFGLYIEVHYHNVR